MEQASSSPTSTRALVVAVIDEDRSARARVERVLRDLPGIDVRGFTHDAALQVVAWAGFDVVVIDPVDPLRRGDQIPGAAVVEHVRACAGPDRPRIVVIGSRHPDDAVRVRLREAGADAYVDGELLGEADRLAQLLAAAGRGEGLPAPVDAPTLAHLGITERSRVNEGLRAAFGERLVPEAAWVGPRGADRSARRERFNLHAQLEPVGVNGQPPEAVPSLAQIQRFVRWATRVDGG